MEKKFFDVFPNLKLDGVQKDLFEQVVVERITSTRRKDILRIYIKSERLIEKDIVYNTEKEIKKQFFPKDDICIKIYERFVLSEQYTPEKLMDIYRDCILLELKQCEHMLYTMFRQADIQFSQEDKMQLVLEDSVIARSKEDELICILDKVINERCGFRVKFEVLYKDAATSKYKEDDEIRIQKIVAGITQRLAANQNSSGEQYSDSNMVVSKDIIPKENAAAKSFETNKKAEKKADSSDKDKKVSPEKSNENNWKPRGAEGGFQRRFPKKSDNPDVIFGRDFEEESIHIEEIWGEMGEVVIRGKVRTLDQREIRNGKTIVSFEITDFTDTIKVKMFVHNEQLEDILKDLKVGAFVKVKGVTVNDTFDRELTIATVIGLKKIPDFSSVRMDNSAKKRVELHCHTKMSDMDGVSD
ncbi:MAG: PolC-type DNA polymerase III, partial [Lachnospiraceae bacterium]|nr:PolC-type DNA polymerase III [Lachnospiraceae bacterium]